MLSVSVRLTSSFGAALRTRHSVLRNLLLGAFVVVACNSVVCGQRMSRQQIKSMHILDRPNRFGHVYGNTVRRLDQMERMTVQQSRPNPVRYAPRPQLQSNYVPQSYVRQPVVTQVVPANPVNRPVNGINGINGPVNASSRAATRSAIRPAPVPATPTAATPVIRLFSPPINHIGPVRARLNGPVAGLQDGFESVLGSE